MAKKTVKLNLSELATIKWLLEAPEKRFIVFTDYAPALYERLPPNPAGLHPIRTIRAAHRSEPPEPELEAFGGKLNISAGSFRDLDFARMYGRARTAYPPKNVTTFEDKVSDVYISGAWHYSCMYVDIDPEAAAVYWETTGKKAYEKLLAAYTSKKLKAKSTERIAIFAKKSALAYSVPANRHFGTMNLIGRVLPPVKVLVPTFQARILRETEARFYIADIERVGGGAIANGITGHGAIQGYSPNYYIDKEHLFLDNATPEAIAQVVAHYNELHEDYARTCDRIVEEVYPILKREMDRAKQKEAEIEDRLSALLSSFNPEKE